MSNPKSTNQKVSGDQNAATDWDAIERAYVKKTYGIEVPPGEKIDWDKLEGISRKSFEGWREAGEVDRRGEPYSMGYDKDGEPCIIYSTKSANQKVNAPETRRARKWSKIYGDARDQFGQPVANKTPKVSAPSESVRTEAELDAAFDNYEGCPTAGADLAKHGLTHESAPSEAVREWKRVLDRSLPDLRVLYASQAVIGFIYKLADTATGKSQWCCNTGCGDTAKLIGHYWTMEQAKLAVEEVA